MSVHDASIGATDEWYTPPYIFKALGCYFDMDVSSPGHEVTPWIPAAEFITRESLEREWRGLVWMNAPFGGRNGLMPWLRKFFLHGSGIALTPDRTSAPWWQEFAAQADAILFVSPKIKFIGADGNFGKSPSDGTSLMAVCPRAVQALHAAAESGLGRLLVAPAKLEAAE